MSYEWRVNGGCWKLNRQGEFIFQRSGKHARNVIEWTADTRIQSFTTKVNDACVTESQHILASFCEV